MTAVLMDQWQSDYVKFSRLVWIESACCNENCAEFQIYKERHCLANREGKGFYMCPVCLDINLYFEGADFWEDVKS